MEILADARTSFRMLTQKPGFALLSILTLSLGIAANTSVFSMVNAVLLRPFPYSEPDRLMLIEGISLNDGYPLRASFPDFWDWRERNKSFSGMAAFRYWGFNVKVGNEVERVNGILASVELFPLLGTEPYRGRLFLPEEDRPGGPRVALISYDLWQSHYASTPDILKQEISLDNDIHSVIGVMPPGFKFPETSEIWAPLALDANRTPRDERNLRVLGRLRAGVDASRASVEMKLLARRLEMEHPDTNAGIGVSMVRFRDFYVRNARPRLLALLGAVCIVLLVACVNVANLLTVRNASREKEIATRAALGASPQRLFRLLLTESFILASLAGVLGLLLSFWILELVLDLVPVVLPFWLEINVDVSVFLFTLALSALTGLLFGTLPAARAMKVDLHQALKETQRNVTGSSRSRLASKTLVVLEVGLTTSLLIVAALTGRSFIELQKADLGFVAENVLTAGIALPEDTYGRPDEQRVFFRNLLEELDGVPGVRSAALTSRLPLSRSDRLVGFAIEGLPSVGQADKPVASVRVVSPQYFKSLGIRLLRGRTFRNEDDSRSERVVIVNDAFAGLFLPEQDWMNRRLNLAGPEEATHWAKTVGIVADVGDYGLESNVRPAIYLPLQQSPSRFMDLVVGVSRAPESLAETLRQKVLDLDPNLPIFNVRTMEQVVADSFWQNRFFAFLFALFALVALALASVGLYGVVSHSVRRRTPEIAVRMSFGASSTQIFRLVAGEGMGAVFIGLILGCLAASGLSRLVSNLLFGVSSKDPATYVSVILVLAAVTFLSCLVPALRASRIDTINSLRAE